MRITTRFRPRKPTVSWTWAQQEALTRITETSELLSSYQKDVAEFPVWQRSVDLRRDLALRQAELARRGIRI